MGVEQDVHLHSYVNVGEPMLGTGAADDLFPLSFVNVGRLPAGNEQRDLGLHSYVYVDVGVSAPGGKSVIFCGRFGNWAGV